MIGASNVSTGRRNDRDGPRKLVQRGRGARARVTLIFIRQAQRDSQRWISSIGLRSDRSDFFPRFFPFQSSSPPSGLWNSRAARGRIVNEGGGLDSYVLVLDLYF